MRVKIEGKWHDGNEEIVLLELTDKDKENILNMKGLYKYCQYPDKYSTEHIMEYMRD